MDTILAAVDNSPYTPVVASYASELAAITGAQVLAAYILDVRLLDGPLARLLAHELRPGDEEGLAEAVAGALERHGREGLGTVEKVCGRLGVSVRTSLERGRPAQALADMAPLYDLAVVGSYGSEAEFRSSLLGATAGEFLRLATRPTMVVREEYRPLRHVLVAYDGSPESAAALNLALRMGEAGGWRVTVLAGPDCGLTAEDLAARVKQIPAGEGAVRAIVSREGAPAHVLLGLVEELAADAVVLGSRGTAKAGQVLLGSTAEILARQAPVPVIVCK